MIADGQTGGTPREPWPRVGADPAGGAPREPRLEPKRIRQRAPCRIDTSRDREVHVGGAPREHDLDGAAAHGCGVRGDPRSGRVGAPPFRVRREPRLRRWGVIDREGGRSGRIEADGAGGHRAREGAQGETAIGCASRRSNNALMRTGLSCSHGRMIVGGREAGRLSPAASEGTSSSGSTGTQGPRRWSEGGFSPKPSCR